jgi:integrase/recombinase XerD
MAAHNHSWGASALPVPILPGIKPLKPRSNALGASEAKSILAAVQSLLSQSESHEGRTLCESLALYLTKQKAKANGEDSMAKNRRELTRFVDFVAQHGKTLAREIDEPFLLSYVDTWEAIYPATSTRNLVRQRLLLFLRYCAQLGDLRIVPDIPKVRQRREPTLPLSGEEYARLLDVAGTIRHRIRVTVPREVRRAVVLLMRWSGAAITDATMMQRSSVFFDETKGIYRCVYRRKKTGVLVNNFLPAEVAKEILAAGALCTSKTHLFHVDGAEGEGPGCKRRWVDWFHKAFKRAGIPGGHSHQLRDTFAVGLLLKGVPLESVAKALGHTSVKTTERYYSPWIKERQDLLDDTIMGAMAGGVL